MRYFTIVLFCFLLTIIVIAQDNCSAFVTDALATVDALCEETGRNELCYGNDIVSVTTIDGAELDFSQKGDIIPVTEVETIRTSPFAEPDEWGIALMRLQANIPDSIPGQNVTFLLFGDTSLSNGNSEIPMQAVYFSSGIGESSCNDVPQDGILIQTPEYDEPIELLVNDVEISLGSTVYLQAEADNKMTVYVLEGFATVTSDDTTAIIPEGAFLWIPIDENLHAIGSPVQAKAYAIENVDSTPVDNLEEEIEIAEPVEGDLVTQTIVVDGNADWIDTGIQVMMGQNIFFSATGEINVWEDCETEVLDIKVLEGFDCDSVIFGPDGGLATINGETFIPDVDTFPAPNIMLHSLIGKTGESEPFAIGKSRSITASTDGILYLRINDSDYNNSGEFVAHILVY